MDGRLQDGSVPDADATVAARTALSPVRPARQHTIRRARASAARRRLRGVPALRTARRNMASPYPHSFTATLAALAVRSPFCHFAYGRAWLRVARLRLDDRVFVHLAAAATLVERFDIEPFPDFSAK